MITEIGIVISEIGHRAHRLDRASCPERVAGV